MKIIKDMYVQAHLIPQMLIEAGITDSQTKAESLVRAGWVKINGKAHNQPEDSVEIAVGDIIAIFQHLIFVSSQGFVVLQEMAPKPEIGGK